jgi:repressor LexA
MVSLTDRQRQVLEFIRKQHRETGVPPSSREIQAHFGFQSQTAAMNHLRALEKKGVIQRHRGMARSAVDPKLKWRPDFQAIPLLGRIPAGMAVDAEESGGANLGLDMRVLGLESSADIFALQVQGNSMIGAQIIDGDTVILQRRPPRNREIVVALIDGESTLKRYVEDGGTPFLKAENPDYPDLIPAAELTIQGVMIGLFRRYSPRGK